MSVSVAPDAASAAALLEQIKRDAERGVRPNHLSPDKIDAVLDALVTLSGPWAGPAIEQWKSTLPPWTTSLPPCADVTSPTSSVTSIACSTATSRRSTATATRT